MRYVPERRCSFGPLRVLLPGALVAGSLAAPALDAENWPTWRGPTGQGIARGSELPLRFGPEEHVKWKAPLPGPGNSTPVVWGDRVYVTQATDEGRERATLCFDRADGTVEWKKTVAYPEPEPTHETNPYCSASPATDGERVVAWYGSAGAYCYDSEGELLWKRDLGTFRQIWGAAGGSPILYEKLCLLNCGPGEQTFCIALDKDTGNTVWKVDIAGGREGGDASTWTGSWSSPVLIAEGERRSVLLSYPHRLLALDPLTGKERWSSGGLGLLVYTSPIAADGVAVSMSGFKGPAMAVRTGGDGDVTETHRLWRHESAAQQIGSGVVHQGHIYRVNDLGIAECLALESGELVWRERLGTRSWSSLVLAGERIYTADQAGNVFVLRAAPKYEQLAHNTLGERVISSLAVSDGELFVRTYEHLWCFAADQP